VRAGSSFPFQYAIAALFVAALAAPLGATPPIDCTTGFPVNLVRMIDHYGDPQRRDIRAKVVMPFGTYDPSVDGAELVISYVPNDIIQLDLSGPTAIPPGLVGTGCDPRDGWKVRPSGYVYRNFSRLLPPTCTDYFGDNGNIWVKTLKIAKSGPTMTLVRMSVRVSASIGGPGAQERLTLVFGRGPTPVAAGLCATEVTTCTVGGVGRCTFPFP
jgi:hypothetical protein